MTLADRIAVFIDGRIVQVGTPREVYARPRTIAVAGFIGTPPMNLMRATWARDEVAIAGQRLPLPGGPAAPRDVMLGVRPGDLRVAPHGLAARVERIEDLGDSSIVSFAMEGMTLKSKGDGLPPIREGEDVRLGFAPDAAHLFDPETGVRL